MIVDCFVDVMSIFPLPLLGFPYQIFFLHFYLELLSFKHEKSFFFSL